VLTNEVNGFADFADGGVKLLARILLHANTRPAEVVMRKELDALLSIVHSPERPASCHGASPFFVYELIRGETERLSYLLERSHVAWLSLFDPSDRLLAAPRLLRQRGLAPALLEPRVFDGLSNLCLHETSFEFVL
jgi:hypothetical protein